MSSVEYTAITSPADSDKEGRDIEASLIPASGGGDQVSPADELPPPDSLRRRILKFLLSKPCEIALLILLACDVILVMAELEIASKVVCRIDWTAGADVIVNNTLLMGNTTVDCSKAEPIELSCEHQRSFQLPVEFAPCPFTVVEELPHGLHIAETAVAWVSRTIIMIFGVELLMLLVCGGPMLFWHHKMYLLDAVIVLVSLILDFVSLSIDLTAIGEIIVIARCWRFARIIHGVGAGVHEQGHEKEKKKNNNEGEEEGEEGKDMEDRTAAET